MTKFVFGAGIALVNNWKLIKKNYDPAYCVDNNSSRWGIEKNTNLPCIGPEQMMTYDHPEVLITVGDPYAIAVIKRQLDALKVPYTILIDKIAEWAALEEFPLHLKSLCQKSKRKILLINTPEHDNIGDHLIALSELEFLNTRFKEYSIFEITDIEYLWFGKELRKYINDDDIILITGGGFLGSLWLYNGENNVRDILKSYRENKVFILPQTVYFEQNDRGKCEYENTLKSYNDHKNLTVIFREEQSFQFFKNTEKIKFEIKLMPDMALYFKEYRQSTDRRSGVLLCIRNDKESILPESDKEYIKTFFEGTRFDVKEISMHSGNFEGIDKRLEQVNEKLNEIASAKIIVTDTLHCMISAAITGTPCIAFDNLSGKVKNVYQWIKDLPYMFFCDDLSEFEDLMEGIEENNYEFKLPYLDQYLDELERQIRGE